MVEYFVPDGTMVFFKFAAINIQSLWDNGIMVTFLYKYPVPDGTMVFFKFAAINIQSLWDNGIMVTLLYKYPVPDGTIFANFPFLMRIFIIEKPVPQAQNISSKGCLEEFSRAVGTKLKIPTMNSDFSVKNL